MHNESARSFFWLSTSIGIEHGSVPSAAKNLWDEISKEMLSRTQSFMYEQDWLSDFWVARGSKITTQFLVPTWNPPESLDDWPMGGQQIAGATNLPSRRTNNPAFSKVLEDNADLQAAYDPAALPEFLQWQAEVKRRGDPRMIQIEHVQAWLATSAGHLLLPIALNPAGATSALIDPAINRLQLCSLVGDEHRYDVGTFRLRIRNEICVELFALAPPNGLDYFFASAAWRTGLNKGGCTVRKTNVLVAAVFFAAAVSPLPASVIFTNTNGTNPGSATALGPSVPVTGPQSIAAAFTPTVNSIMNEAQVMAQAAGGDPEFNLYLYSNSGSAPGSSIETLGTDVAPNLFPTPPGLVAITGFAPITLTAGTQYWLVMTPFGAATKVGWTTGGVPAVQTDASPTSNGAAPWSALASTSVQFEIDGTLSSSTPEPAMAGLVGAGLGALLLLRRQRRGSSRSS